ncbi:phospholipid phosphatase-related protein type 5-like [Ylistrum balloti]|uniref:phospholipid phosphatase-related protein type 5-like n=1 Tax=Ylistrum balloti TaxID=509963 RepID=UPI002905D038|nr:phospholipid phosphatase-related protein type 5-like [Ylistrum balloti]
MAVDEHNRKDGIETFIVNQTREEDGEEDNGKNARKNSLVLATFLLELIILVFMVVLEYFLRWTSLFPIVRLSFSCTDPSISARATESGFASFVYDGSVPHATIYALSFCVPPFVVLVGEIGVWAFTDERQKPIWLSCNGMKVPQVVRRLIRFIGVFVFGAFTVMVFADVTKLLTGRLRPVFLEVCRVNHTLCDAQGGQGSDELCAETDEMRLRYARTSFPSMYSALSAYSAIFLTIYLHGAMRTRSVRIIRPFLSLAFVMLALLCGLLEYGLRVCHWDDVVVGLAMGVAIAVYFGSAILHNFREHVPEKIVLSLLHRFLLDNQILEELLKESGQLKLPKSKDLYIPRAHMRRTSGLEDDDTKQRARMYDHFQRDLSTTVDHFRERRNSQMDPTTQL